MGDFQRPKAHTEDKETQQDNTGNHSGDLALRDVERLFELVTLCASLHYVRLGVNIAVALVPSLEVPRLFVDLELFVRSVTVVFVIEVVLEVCGRHSSRVHVPCKLVNVLPAHIIRVAAVVVVGRFKVFELRPNLYIPTVSKFANVYFGER
jgi:hypothetical protein